MPLTLEEKQSMQTAFGSVDKRLKAVEQSREELENGLDNVLNKLAKYGRTLMGRSVRDETYHGFWRDDVMARDFANVLAHTVGKSELAEKTMSESSGATGGFTVPEELATWLIDRLGRYGTFRRNAMTVQMGSEKLHVPAVAADLTIYSPGEGAAITQSDMSFKLVQMAAQKLAALCAITSELDEDSIVGMGEIVGISVTRSMAKVEDEIGFVGDGTDTYFGMTGICSALLGVDNTIGNIEGLHVGTGNAWSELDLGDFEATAALLPEDADGNAKWYCSKQFYWNVMHPLALAAGAADMFAILSAVKQRHFMGYPVEFTAAMPKTEANSQICALLGDLELGAYLGERKALDIVKSPHPYFSQDLIAIRAIERIDINAYGVGDTSEAGPIVGLITAAS